MIGTGIEAGERRVEATEAAARRIGGKRFTARLRLLSLPLFAAVWQVGAMAAESRALPGPLAVAQALAEGVSTGALPYHLGATLARVAASFLLAMVIGTAIGIALAHKRRLDELFDSWLVIGLNVPALVTIILCYVWFGLNEAAAVLAVTLNKVPTVAVLIREGARAVDPELMQVAHGFRLGRRRRFFRVYLPQLYPHLIAAGRSGLALVWKIVLVVELLGRSNGVGFQLGVFFQLFEIASILAYTLAFTVVILAAEMALLRPFERRLTRWRL